MDKKYFSKAVLYDEKKNIIMSMLAHGFLFFITILMFWSSISIYKSDDTKVHNTSVLINNIPYGLMYIICIFTIFYSYNNKESKYNFFFTQPFSRDSIIITRILAHMISYTIPMVFYGIISSILILIHKDIYGDNIHSLIRELNSTLFTLFIVLTIMNLSIHLLEMLLGKSIAAGILPIPICVLIAMEYFGITQVTSKKIPLLRGLYKNIEHYFNRFYDITTNYIDVINYHFNFIQSILVILLIALVFYICVLLNRKIKIENISNTFMFKVVEKIFIFLISMLIVAIFSIMLICLICAVLYVIFQSKEFTTSDNATQIMLLFMDIIMAVMSIAVYKLIIKITEKRRAK